MKRFAPAAFALLLPLLAPADWVLENQVEGPSAKMVATIKAKGDKFRIDVAEGPRGAMSTILDTASGQIVQLAHTEKEARKISSETIRMQIEARKKKTAPSAEPVPPKPTGEKEKIGDWDCEIYTWENDTTSAKLWVATNVPKAAEIKAMLEKLNSGGLSDPQTTPNVSTLPGVVVKTESISARGKSTMSIASIKEQSVDAEEFVIPKDYEVKKAPVNLRGVPPPRTGFEKIR